MYQIRVPTLARFRDKEHRTFGGRASDEEVNVRRRHSHPFLNYNRVVKAIPRIAPGTRDNVCQKYLNCYALEISKSDCRLTIFQAYSEG